MEAWNEAVEHTSRTGRAADTQDLTFWQADSLRRAAGGDGWHGGFRECGLWNAPARGEVMAKD